MSLVGDQPCSLLALTQMGKWRVHHHALCEEQWCQVLSVLQTGEDCHPSKIGFHRHQSVEDGLSPGAAFAKARPARFDLTQETRTIEPAMAACLSEVSIAISYRCMKTCFCKQKLK